MTDHIRDVVAVSCIVCWSAGVLAQPASIPEAPTAAAVEAQLAELDAATDLDASAVATLRDLYRTTLDELDSAERWRDRSLEWQGRTSAAPDTLAEVEAALATSVEATESATSSLEEAEQALSQARSELDAATARLVELDAEPIRRASRRAAIREELASVAERLKQVDAELAAPPATNDGPDVMAARQALLAARRATLDRHTTSLQHELLAYDAEVPLVPRQRDLATREATVLEQYIRGLRDQVSALRREDASRQMDAAREVARGAYARMLRGVVEQNAALANRRIDLIERLEQAERQREVLVSERQALSERFMRTRERVEAIGRVPAVGLVLRNQRESLPDVRQYRRLVEATEETTRLIQTEMFDLDEQRQQLSDLDAAISRVLVDLNVFWDDPAEDERLTAAVRSVLETQRTSLDLLLGDLSRYFDLLVEIGLAQHEIVTESRVFLEFIDERILWTRSAGRLSASGVIAAQAALSWLIDRGGWSRVGDVLTRDISSYPLTYVLVVGLLVVLARQRRPLKRALAEAGEVAARHSTVTYGPTVLALLVTAILAGVGLGLVWLLAQRLETRAATAFTVSIATGLAAVALTVGPLEFLRRSCSTQGLMTAHFGWPVEPVTLLRRHLRWFLPSIIPVVFVFAVMSSQDDPGRHDSLGRVALVLLQLLTAAFLQRLLNPKSGLFHGVLAAHPAGWLSRLRLVWYGGAVAVPILLGTVAALGYVYTAGHLLTRLLSTLWLAVGITAAVGMMSRWVLVSRRRLAMQQRRKRLRSIARDETSDTTGRPVPEDSLPDLAALDTQTRQLIRAGSTVTAFVGTWLIWSDIVPAMGVLDRVTLWTLPGTDPGTTQPFTLEDLAMTLVLVALTVLAARNIPAVIEMTLLQRLPLQAGLRYAMTTISRYALGAVGLLVIFNVLGVTWSSVQWLVAAFGVGLGFGLQEIFANFVSGIILLFERPVRVGDTVTVGETTGTVMKIRMRATTILDWDLKELVVPNKDLVTGRLVNWTLSDSSNRITMSVGVAYGSDPAHVTKVLREIIDGMSRIRKMPEPFVTFEQFGDSALIFTLRLYLSELTDRLPVLHDMHTAIAERFQDEGIEIAFPQLDIHLRSAESAEAADASRPPPSAPGPSWPQPVNITTDDASSPSK